jgi:hypothetical protein
LAAKYQTGAGRGCTDRIRAARPVSEATKSSAGIAALSAASRHSRGPNINSGTAVITKNGRTPPDDFTNSTAPARTQTLPMTMSSRRAIRQAPTALSARTAAKPATKPISRGTVVSCPNASSMISHVTMMMLPATALTLHSRIRLCRSTARPSFTPSRTIRSNRRPSGASRSAIVCARGRAPRDGPSAWNARLNLAQSCNRPPVALFERGCRARWLKLAIAETLPTASTREGIFNPVRRFNCALSPNHPCTLYVNERNGGEK